MLETDALYGLRSIEKSITIDINLQFKSIIQKNINERV